MLLKQTKRKETVHEIHKTATEESKAKKYYF